MSATTMSSRRFVRLRDADRMEIRNYHGRTDRLTVVGARDTCVSQNLLTNLNRVIPLPETKTLVDLCEMVEVSRRPWYVCNTI